MTVTRLIGPGDTAKDPSRSTDRAVALTTEPDRMSILGVQSRHGPNMP